MVNPETVIVYAFLYPPGRDGVRPVSTFKATRESIVKSYGGSVIEGTAEDVPLDALDSRGRFRRIATAWGAFE